MEVCCCEEGLNMKETELRLALPGREEEKKKKKKDGVFVKKRWLSSDCINKEETDEGLFFLPPTPSLKEPPTAPPASSCHGFPPSSSKARVIGWPPIRCFRKNAVMRDGSKAEEEAEVKSAPACLFVKVSMDGAPYLRKVDLKNFDCYIDLSSALEKMFTCFSIGQCDGFSESRVMDLLHGSEYVLTYEDRDGDWMLVGDVPWDMFMESCRRLRIMLSSEAIGLAPRAIEKCRSRS